jgi:glutamine---fructose-6-phosphate transaminase (isomerizing)
MKNKKMENDIPAALKHIFKREKHPFLMWDGIQEIPSGFQDVLSPEVRSSIREAARAARNKKRIILTGCGTSYYTAIAATYSLHALAGIPATAVEAFEFQAYPSPGLAECAVIGISHTGETPVSVEGIELARKADAVTIAVTDLKDSALARHAEFAAVGELGREPALPKTRSFVTALLRVYLFSLELAAMRGSNPNDHFNKLESLPEMASSWMHNLEQPARDIADRTKGLKRVFISGGGPQYVTALEASLKLTEAALRTAVPWEIEEAVHGSWASTQQGDLAIILAFDGPSFDKAQTLASGMDAIDTDVWMITDNPDRCRKTEYLSVVDSSFPEIFSPLPAIIPLYYFTYFSALNQGIKPDLMRMDDDRYYKARGLMRSSVS